MNSNHKELFVHLLKIYFDFESDYYFNNKYRDSIIGSPNPSVNNWCCEHDFGVGFYVSGVVSGIYLASVNTGSVFHYHWYADILC